jgi:hypothetical protein
MYRTPKLATTPARDKLTADPALLRAVRAWRRAKAMLALARLGDLPRRAA